MQPAITLQLYTLREKLTADFEGTIRAVAAMGFRCVEPAGFPGSSVSAAAKLFADLGLTAPSAHSPLPVGDATQEVIESALALGHRYLITGVPPGGREHYSTVDDIKAAAEQYCLASENAAAHGLQVGYHNHDWDLAIVDGVPAYERFLALTPETVLWEADLFWIAKAGLDPVSFLAEIGPRGKVLHFKDGHIQRPEITPPFLPAGEGDIDLIAASKAAKHAELIAVELDEFGGDMVEAVQKSYTYLTQNKIAQGN